MSQNWSKDIIKVKVRYRCPGSAPQLHTVKMKKSDTVANLISHVKASKGLTFKHQRLERQANSTLAECNIKDGSIINLGWSYVQPKRTTDFTIKINVEQMPQPLKLPLLSSITINQLSHMLQDEIGMPVAEQRFLHQGKEIKNRQRLVEQYHVRDDRGPFVLQWKLKDVDTDCTNDHQEEPDQEPLPSLPPPLSQPNKKALIRLTRIPDNQVSTKGLRKVSQKMMNWEPLAPCLGIEPQKEVVIEKNHPNDYEEQKYQLLFLWWRLNGKDATWRALATAVYECPKERFLIDNIEEISTAEKSLPACTTSDIPPGSDIDTSDIQTSIEESQATAPRQPSPRHSTASLGETHVENTDDLPTAHAAEREYPHGQPDEGHHTTTSSKKQLTPQELADQLKQQIRNIHRVRSVAIKLELSQEYKDICANFSDNDERLRQFCDIWLANDPEASLEKFISLF